MADPAVLDPNAPTITPPVASPADIVSTAAARLYDWIKLQGGNAMAAIGLAPTPGSFIAAILAFLQKILPLLGCILPVAGQSTAEAQKQYATDHPILTQMHLTRLAQRHGTFARKEIPNAVAAAYHLLTVSPAADYATFAAAA